MEPVTRDHPAEPDIDLAESAGDGAAGPVALARDPNDGGYAAAGSGAQPDSPPTTQVRPWHPALRAAFRFGFLYLVLYNLPFPLGVIPGTGLLARPWTALWEAVVPWVGRSILAVGYPITVLPNGSGDTTWNYVQIFCFVVIAAAGTVLWTALDRRRRAYPQLHIWLRIYVRLVLGATMISYGAFKVIKSQFPFPSIDRLAQPFGDASPMGLLWTFMGYSNAYNVFTGLGELVGGLLLFFRRTTTLGSLLLIAILANVVILNFAFDVPVKLYSSHLLVMAIVLVLPDVRRLFDVLVLDRPTRAAAPAPAFSGRKWNRIATVGKLAFLALVLGVNLDRSASARRTYGDAAPEPPLVGLYDTEEFVRDGVAVPPAAEDSTRWRRLTVGRTGFVAIRGMPAEHRANYRMTTDESAGTVRLAALPDSSRVHVLSYRLDQAEAGAGERLVLSGLFDGASIRVTLRRREASDFLLVNRGFHWINEYPFNR